MKVHYWTSNDVLLCHQDLRHMPSGKLAVAEDRDKVTCKRCIALIPLRDTPLMNIKLQIEAEVYGVKKTDEGIKCEVYRPCIRGGTVYGIDLLIPEALMRGLKGGDKLTITIQQKE